jgi:hypothetical protein
MLFGLFQICKRSDPLQSSTLSGAEPRLERDERQRGACIEGCGERGESWQTRTPFDWLRTGFDTAFTEPFDMPFDKLRTWLRTQFRPTQDASSLPLNGYPHLLRKEAR